MRNGATPTLTPAGISVVCGAIALGVLGWALGYLALTVIAAATIAGVVAGALATMAVPRLDVERVIEPPRVERGRPALGLVSVSNGARRRSRPCSAVELIARATSGESGPSADETVDIDIPALAGGRSVAVPYQLPTSRRGAMTVGPLAIVRRDPFGLWQARRPVGDTVTLFVQPRIHPLDPRPAGRTRHLEGPISETAPRGTMTFHSLREYTAGDDIRRVHWRSTARTGTLMVREHVDNSLPSTVVVLDTRSERYEGDTFEEAVDVAASIVAASQRRGFPVRLLTTAGEVLVSRAGQRGQNLFDFLTAVETRNGDTLRRATTEVLRGRDHDAIAVVGGDLDSADLAEVTTMTRRFATSALVTLRSTADTSALRWTDGTHLDGATAVAALAHWRSARGTRTTSRAMA